ncbi:hypothetical protein JWG45_11220 [Leptospira sp. 201903070]|uniref:Uncharacterized protein n=1 Tax=Leptospira ainlahdjerensis TaxID=2810033 RepID=A0ABS2UBH6_9LEPT|nr:hypothetical protein [Leptospira ainlahdjerensis]MBM9577698.1 hypothetical protein [Leptospira ainlahdjerensis]MBM9577722.1 hypothetical protein [Leptospira ainlahdjerensis]
MRQSIFTFRIFSYGIIVWVIPFVLAIPLFQLLGSNRLFFKSILGVILALTVVVFWGLYLRTVNSDFQKHSYSASVLWLVLSIVPDLLAFIIGFKMNAFTYFTEIAISYLVIPVILIGSSWILDRKLQGKSYNQNL